MKIQYEGGPPNKRIDSFIVESECVPTEGDAVVVKNDVHYVALTIYTPNDIGSGIDGQKIDAIVRLK